MPPIPPKPLFDEPERYNYYTELEFDFDPAKSALNQAKHGIDFIEAQKLWADDNRVILQARSVVEPRKAAIGRIGTNIWTGIHTVRNGIIRIISVRRARHDEKEFYRKGAEDDDCGRV